MGACHKIQQVGKQKSSMLAIVMIVMTVIMRVNSYWARDGHQRDCLEHLSCWQLSVMRDMEMQQDTFFKVTVTVYRDLNWGGSWPTGLLCPWNSPGKNTAVGCHSLLQGIFPTQESNPHLLCLLIGKQFLTTSTAWEAHKKGSYCDFLGSLSFAAAAESLRSCSTLCDPIDRIPRLPRPWDSPGKNTGVGCHFLLQCTKVKTESE